MVGAFVLVLFLGILGENSRSFLFLFILTTRLAHSEKTAKKRHFSENKRQKNRGSNGEFYEKLQKYKKNKKNLTFCLLLFYNTSLQGKTTVLGGN